MNKKKIAISMPEPDEASSEPNLVEIILYTLVTVVAFCGVFMVMKG